MKRNIDTDRGVRRHSPIRFEYKRERLTYASVARTLFVIGLVLAVASFLNAELLRMAVESGTNIPETAAKGLFFIFATGFTLMVPHIVNKLIKYFENL